MNPQSKCFILTTDGYEEITYAELTQRRERDPGYRDKRFIPLHGMLLEVAEADYKAFYRCKRRQKYLAEEAARVGEFSFADFQAGDMNGEAIIADTSSSVAEVVARNIMLDELHLAWKKLEPHERSLLIEIYVHGKSEQVLAWELGISQQAVSKRAQKVVSKLGTLMKF
jgi:RNA polymerase sigma factor (sigma-70 family)